MNDRVYFKNSEDRIYFFSRVREAGKFKNWLELSKSIGSSRNMIDRYRNGELLIPHDRFSKLVNILSLNERDYFNSLILTKPGNWGAVKGGKITYAKYPEHLEENRKKALKTIALKYNCDADTPLSENFCEVLGAFIGDGYYNSYKQGSYLIQFAGNTSLDMNYYKNIIIPYIQSIFPNVKPNPYFIIKDNCLWVSFYSKALFNLFNKRFNFPIGKKCYTVRIPYEILQSDDKFIRATIRGIFDTDGCIFFDKRKIYKSSYPRITFQTSSYDLYVQLKDYLSKDFSLYTSERPKRKFYIEIYGHPQLNKWMSLIGFSNSRHLNKLPR